MGAPARSCSAGYRTAYFGKLMNGYGKAMFGRERFAPVLPGFDQWRVSMGSPM